MAEKDKRFSPVPGTNTFGDAVVAKAMTVGGMIRLRIGLRHDPQGSQGKTRVIDLEPERAALIVMQLGAAIEKVLRAKASAAK